MPRIIAEHKFMGEGAICPPDGVLIKFAIDVEGRNVSEHVDKRTARANLGIPGFSIEPDDEDEAEAAQEAAQEAAKNEEAAKTAASAEADEKGKAAAEQAAARAKTAAVPPTPTGPAKTPASGKKTLQDQIKDFKAGLSETAGTGEAENTNPGETTPPPSEDGGGETTTSGESALTPEGAIKISDPLADRPARLADDTSKSLTEEDKNPTVTVAGTKVADQEAAPGAAPDKVDKVQPSPARPPISGPKPAPVDDRTLKIEDAKKGAITDLTGAAASSPPEVKDAGAGDAEKPV